MKICRCFDEDKALFFLLCRFLQIMRCIFLRAHAPARAINIIVHVFILLLHMLKKYAAQHTCFSVFYEKTLKNGQKKVV